MDVKKGRIIKSICLLNLFIPSQGWKKINNGGMIKFV